MNAEQANGIDLSAVLEKLGFHPAKAKGYDLWYCSPLRKESTPSFHVHAVKNVWHDFGDGRSGTVVDFVCAWLEVHNEDHTVVDALRWLNNMLPSYRPVRVKEDFQEEGSSLHLRNVIDLEKRSLIDYLASRGIPLTLARKYLKEVHVQNKESGKTFYAIGFRSMNGGYELRNKFFKGCIAPKGISFIRGRKVLPDEVHVFEGFMDFLSALAWQKDNKFDGDVIVLNSVHCLSQALPYIKNYSYTRLYSWLDNDYAGEQAAYELKKAVEAQKDFVFELKNELYSDYKDVNEWHVNKLDFPHARKA